MSTSFDVPAVGRLYPQDALKLSLYFAAAYLSYHVVWAIYSAYFSPLSKFPGPKLWAVTKWPHMMTIFRGSENTVIPALHEKYGPVVRIGPTQLSYAEGGKAWKDIYGFKKHGQSAPYKDPFFYGKPFNKVDNLITADDANHTRQRKMISHSFADKTLRDLEPMLKYWVGKMKDKLGEKATAGEQVDMLKYYNCTTFDIMGDLSFNEGLNMLEDGEYSPWVKTIFGSIKMASRIRAMKMISSLSEWFVKKFMQNNPKVLTIQAQHWNYTAERVDRRLAKTPERTDLWTRILEKSQGPGGLTLGEHQSNASLFMIAGTETTATALSGLTFHLLKNKKYLDLITKEIRENFKSFEDMDLESLQRLKYLHAVLQEGLRMYPPVPTVLPRRTPKGGSIICDQFVPEGTSIGVHQLSTYRNKDSFKDPYSFRPERWLGDPEFKNDHLDALEPFSVGPRNCLGKNLAWHEMRLIFATVLLKFDLELCEESDQWATQRVYTLWEKKPLMCRLTPAKA